MYSNNVLNCRNNLSNSEITSLFPEILSIIFSYLDVQSKGRACQVCRSWRDVGYAKQVWRNVKAYLHISIRDLQYTLFPSLVKRGIKHVQILSLKSSLGMVIDGIPALESLILRGVYNVSDTTLTHAFQQHPLPNLVELDLSFCKQISDQSLNKVARSTHNLRILSLTGCSNITSRGLTAIAMGMPDLRSLNVCSCRRISDNGILTLAGLSPETASGTLLLEKLILQDCEKLTDIALKHISTGLVKLRVLNISLCYNVTDAGLKFISGMPELESLNLQACDGISDQGVGRLATCSAGDFTGDYHRIGVNSSNLRHLNISFCDRVGDQSLGILARYGSFRLHSISLCSPTVTDVGLVKLLRSPICSQLRALRIGQCASVTDATLEAAHDLEHLRHIDLYGCLNVSQKAIESFRRQRAEVCVTKCIDSSVHPYDEAS